MLPVFKNRTLVIATMHKKEQVIGPALEKALGVKCIVAPLLNTDRFGTFTREIKRPGNMIETAKAKIKTALKIINADLAIASEGSFSTHSSLPGLQTNLELTLLVDTKNQFEVKGVYQTNETNMNGGYIKTVEEAIQFSKKCGFPEHGIIVRLHPKYKYFLYKEIRDENELIKTVETLLKIPFNKTVYLETDMRAHKNPTRMKAIKASIENLIESIHSACPECDFPGFVITEIEKGLPCRGCGLPSPFPLKNIYRCNHCHYEKTEKTKQYGPSIDPSQCLTCNP